jgi:hypothetical protein
VIERGQLIEDLLSRPAVQEVFAEIEQDLFDAWKSGATQDEREAAHSDYRAFERLKDKFRAFVDRGVQAISEAGREERRLKEI